MPPKAHGTCVLRHAGVSVAATSTPKRAASKRASTSAQDQNSKRAQSLQRRATVHGETAAIFNQAQAGPSRLDVSADRTPCVDNISSEELEEIRSLKRPPRVVQRALELTYMLLMVSERPMQSEPPDWTSVQRFLAESGLRTRMLRYDLAVLRKAPDLLSFIKKEYFSVPSGIQSSVSNSRLSAPSFDEVLSCERLLRANRAAAALFQWCSMIVSSVEDALAIQEPVAEEDSQPVLEPFVREAAVVQESVAHVAVQDVALPTRVEDTPKLEAKPDRHFEVLVPSLSYAMKTSITLPVLVEIMLARPGLSLELVASLGVEGLYKAPEVQERLHHVRDYFRSQEIPASLRKGFSRDHEAGITCLIHLDNDAAMIRHLQNPRNAIRLDVDLEAVEEVECSNPDEEALEDVIYKMEDWCETRLHF